MDSTKVNGGNSYLVLEVRLSQGGECGQISITVSSQHLLEVGACTVSHCVIATTWLAA